MKRTSFVIAGALALGVVFGAVAAPAFRAGSASAQSQTQKTGKVTVQGYFLDRLAAALGIGRPALDGAIKKAGAETVDQAVKDGKLKADQAAKIKARIDKGETGWLWQHRGDKRGAGRQFLAQAAKALNMQPKDFIAELKAGKTVEAIAKEHGSSEQAVVDAVLKAAKARLDAAVKAGKLTQAQADKGYAGLQKRVPLALHSINRDGRTWGHGGAKRNHGAKAAAGQGL